MKPEYWNVWAVSLFDLIVVVDQIKTEQSFIEYLDAHSTIQKEEIEFMDELDLLYHFLNGIIENEIYQHPMMIVGGADVFSSVYDGILPIAH